MSLCHAWRAWDLLSLPLTPRLTTLPSTVAYQLFVCVLNQGFAGRPIAMLLAMPDRVYCTFAAHRRVAVAGNAGISLGFPSWLDGFDFRIPLWSLSKR
jgi:hypothetical protein